MSRRRRHPQPTMLFPTADEADACNHWCAGLHQVERAVAGQQFAEFFRIEDFMMMGMVRTPGQPDIYLHKHALTRLYLNVDIAGHAYRYVASRFDLEDPGEYLPYADLVAAIDHLELFQMPWLEGSAFTGSSMGIDIDDHERHPATMAWWRRWHEHGCPPLSGFLTGPPLSA